MRMSSCAPIFYSSSLPPPSKSVTERSNMLMINHDQRAIKFTFGGFSSSSSSRVLKCFINKVAQDKARVFALIWSIGVIDERLFHKSFLRMKLAATIFTIQSSRLRKLLFICLNFRILKISLRMATRCI